MANPPVREPPEIPPPTPGTPTVPPIERPPGNPRPEVPPPIDDPARPPQPPQELPGGPPDEVPVRGSSGPQTLYPVIDPASPISHVRSPISLLEFYRSRERSRFSSSKLNVRSFAVR